MVEGNHWDRPSELDGITICGENGDRALVPALAPAPVYGGSYTDAEGRHVDPVRVAIWTVTSLIALCVFVLALAAWGRSATADRNTVASRAAYPLQVVFGDRGTNTSAPYGPDGSSSACTDESIDPQTGSWSCSVWSPDTAGFPISSAAAPTGGACTEQRVDESVGRWVCVSSQ